MLMFLKIVAQVVICSAVGVAVGFWAGHRKARREMKRMIHSGALALGPDWPRGNSLQAMTNRGSINALKNRLAL